jgi:hypothetical protein
MLLAAGLADGALAFGLARAWPGPVAATLFVLLCGGLILFFVLAYWLVGRLTLRYTVTRDGLVLQWAASRTSVPMGEITHILQGRPYAEPLHGLRWPGHEVGRTTLVADDGSRRELLVLATVPPEGQLIVMTPSVAYALSPADRSAFVRELMARRRMGPVQQLPHGTAHPVLGRLGIVRDALAIRLLAAGLVANVLAFAWLIWQYPSLPAQVALWFGFDTATGRPAAILQPLALAWQLPAIGFLAWALDAGAAGVVHARARLGAELLALGALLLQLVVIVTLLRMVP